jgi:aryl-alcohol dehydrogenase-like predicted oxidoreductase
MTTRESFSAEGDWRSLFPRFSGDNFEANVRLISQLRDVADKKKCTLAQLALAWLLGQGHDIIPIPGTKKIKYLEENWAALQVELTDIEMAELTTLMETVGVAGARVMDAALAQCFIDTVEE